MRMIDGRRELERRGSDSKKLMNDVSRDPLMRSVRRHTPGGRIAIETATRE
jgi:hypothetical protein